MVSRSQTAEAETRGITMVLDERGREGLLPLQEAGASERYPSYSTLRRMIRRGQLQATRFIGDNRIYIDPHELEQVIRQPLMMLPGD